MGKLCSIVAIISILGIAYLSKCVLDCLGDIEQVPEIPDTYFGPGKTKAIEDDTNVYPFEIKIDEKVLDDLKDRLTQELNSGRIKSTLEGIGFQYGFNSKYLQTIGKYWLTKYNWREREKRLNQYPQFKTKISGLNIHFQHVKSANNKNYKHTKPLLLLHGWPGSFVEFSKSISLLLDPKDSEINFELIIPSLPGYGFSDGASKPGLNGVQMGKIFVKLMQRLGHDQFYVQARGDWGSIIGSDMITVWPQNVLALHSNLCASLHPWTFVKQVVSSIFPSYFLSKDEADRLLPYTKGLKTLLAETGYAHIQATKPDTIGVGLSLSSHGLAAYIIEKFSIWTDPEKGLRREDGGLPESKLSLDDLLDNVMIYWVTNSITTSFRLYSEVMSASYSSLRLESIPVKNPVGCFIPPKEFYHMHSEWMLQDKFRNLVSYELAPRGGHFIAYEEPELFSQSVVKFFQSIVKSS